jgi:hypothetical protein
MAKPTGLPTQATGNAASQAHLPTELPPADPPPPPQPEVGPPNDASISTAGAAPDPDDFAIIIIGGAPEGREPVVMGTVDGSLGGPDTSIAIELHLRPPASDTADIEVVQAFDHLHLHLQFDLLA